MKSCGVIVEYNPFHLGHKYHLEKAREVSQADVIVAVMSGNFLQRGEPAIVDKWQRARQALLNGADVIIELPFSYAVQSADYFTRGGIRLLHALEVEVLCFGTDSETILDYDAFGQFHKTHLQEINDLFQQIKNNGQSYPQQMTAIYRKLLPDWPLDFSSPNHILGMGYAKENAMYKKPMKLYPIKRIGNHYHERELIPHSYASATSIRHNVKNGLIEETSQFLPIESFTDLKNSHLVDWNLAWPLLKYQLVSSTTEELANVYQMVEGLEHRFKDAASTSASFGDFMQNIKSKRYTWTRMQRLCLYVLLQIKKDEIEKNWNNTYLRVLGFNESGRRFLKERKNKTSFPLITNSNQKNESQLVLDIRAGEVYSLLNGNDIPQDYYRKPIYIRE